LEGKSQKKYAQFWMLAIVRLKKFLSSFSWIENRRNHKIFNCQRKVMPLITKQKRGRLTSAQNGRRRRFAGRSRREKREGRDISRHSNPRLALNFLGEQLGNQKRDSRIS